MDEKRLMWQIPWCMIVLNYIEDDYHEVLWIRLKPKKLQIKYSCIIIACINNPSGLATARCRSITSECHIVAQINHGSQMGSGPW